VATAVVAGAVLAASLGGRKAEAFPAYAKKENKPCSFCHVRAAGGGKRTPAGDYYKAHSLSLVGFGGSAAPAKPPVKAKPGKPPVKPGKKTAKPTAGKKP
jgi:hypothetical protein